MKMEVRMNDRKIISSRSLGASPHLAGLIGIDSDGTVKIHTGCVVTEAIKFKMEKDIFSVELIACMNEKFGRVLRTVMKTLTKET